MSMSMSVTFRTIPYEAFRNPPADPKDLECPTCLSEFNEEEILVGHEGIGILGHPLHESCFKKDILRQHKLGLEIAACSSCRQSILNTNDYLPPPTWSEKTIQFVKKFANQHKIIAGIAVGAISMGGTFGLNKLLLPMISNHYSIVEFVVRVATASIFAGHVPYSAAPFLGSNTVVTKEFFTGMGAGSLIAGITTSDDAGLAVVSSALGVYLAMQGARR